MRENTEVEQVGPTIRAQLTYPTTLAAAQARQPGRRWLRVVLLVLMNGALLMNAATAAESHRPVRIGALTTSWGPTPMVQGLREGLLALGYREPEDFEIGVRFTRGDHKDLPMAARQLVQHGVDVIFVGRAESARVARAVTTHIPIVFAAVSDPVGAGLVESFARPGGNLTGVSDLGHALGPKRLEVFRDILPDLRRILFPYHATDPDHLAELKIYRAAAHRIGIELLETPLRTEVEAKAALARIPQDNAVGLLTPRCCLLNIPGLILESAARKALPTMFRQAFWVENGALASYGPDYHASGLQAARLVDKILKGAKPAEIPVEVNPKIEFAISRKAAQTMGLTIAPEVWFKADRVIQ